MEMNAQVVSQVFSFLVALTADHVSIRVQHALFSLAIVVRVVSLLSMDNAQLLVSFHALNVRVGQTFALNVLVAIDLKEVTALKFHRRLLSQHLCRHHHLFHHHLQIQLLLNKVHQRKLQHQHGFPILGWSQPSFKYSSLHAIERRM